MSSGCIICFSCCISSLLIKKNFHVENVLFYLHISFPYHFASGIVLNKLNSHCYSLMNLGYNLGYSNKNDMIVKNFHSPDFSVVCVVLCLDFCPDEVVPNISLTFVSYQWWFRESVFHLFIL